MNQLGKNAVSDEIDYFPLKRLKNCILPYLKNFASKKFPQFRQDPKNFAESQNKFLNLTELRENPHDGRLFREMQLWELRFEKRTRDASKMNIIVREFCPCLWYQI